LKIVCRERADVDLELAIEDVNRRAEALDVLFGIARASGLTFYSVEGAGSESMIVTLTHVACDAQSLPIPEPTQSPRYDLDRGSTSTRALAPQTASARRLPIGEWIENVKVVAVLLVFIGVLCFFAYGVSMQSRVNAHYAAVARQIEATGATVIRTGIDVGDENIFGDGFFVNISDPDFGDDDLKSMLELLDELSLYGLDLSGTSITDNAVADFVGRPSMFMLLARNTRLTAEAAITLARTNIQCLDVRDTAIVLDDLKHWSEYRAINVLYISDADITAEDLQWLDHVPYLDYVLVNDVATTKQLLPGLNKALSPPENATEFEKVQFLDAFSVKLAPPPEFYHPH
jgi:hypothetical protein